MCTHMQRLLLKDIVTIPFHVQRRKAALHQGLPFLLAGMWPPLAPSLSTPHPESQVIHDLCLKNADVYTTPSSAGCWGPLSPWGRTALNCSLRALLRTLGLCLTLTGRNVHPSVERMCPAGGRLPYLQDCFHWIQAQLQGRERQRGKLLTCVSEESDF